MTYLITILLLASCGGGSSLMSNTKNRKVLNSPTAEPIQKIEKKKTNSSDPVKEEKANFTASDLTFSLWQSTVTKYNEAYEKGLSSNNTEYNNFFQWFENAYPQGVPTLDVSIIQDYVDFKSTPYGYKEWQNFVQKEKIEGSSNKFSDYIKIDKYGWDAFKNWLEWSNSEERPLDKELLMDYLQDMGVFYD